MSVITVEDGALVVKDPADSKTFVWDWDADNLPAGVTIVSAPFIITPIAPSHTDALLGKDYETIVVGARKTYCRLLAGTLGQIYDVANRITTSETPPQIKERSVRILVQDR